MRYSELYENKKHGTLDFPIELYCVNETKPRYQMPFHWHIEYEMILVRQGSFELTVDGKKYQMAQGDCAWIGSGTVHGGIPQNCEYACIVFDLQSFLHHIKFNAKSAAVFLSNSDIYTGVYHPDTAVAQQITSIFTAMETHDKGYEWITLGLLCQLIGEFIAATTQEELPVKDRVQIQKLKDVLRYIRKNIDQPVTLTELATVCGMSPKYFCRAFRSMTGKTPIEYVNFYRVETACEMLATTSDSITEIALNCGFNDMSYFSKIFSRLKGTSPSQFRKDFHKEQSEQ